MASATIETFCCISSNIEPSILSKLQFYSLPYNIVCAISAIFGTVGALYQIIPSPREASMKANGVANRQRNLIKWLAVADFVASLAILIRSIYWLIIGDIIEDENIVKNTDLIVCAILSILIRYFYTATALWTLCYAIDVYLVSKQRSCNHLYFHLFTWIISAILTVTGLGTLYLPKFHCHSGLWRVLPNYLLSFVPIVIVMILNPLLYNLASKNLRTLISGSLGQLTCLEQNLLSALKTKFFCIVLVFYVCWIPNVINGIILWCFWSDIPQRTVLTVWYSMAFLNPLQAVFNSLVYKGWRNCPLFCPTIFCRNRSNDNPLIEERSSDYHLSSADDSLNFSANGEVQ